MIQPAHSLNTSPRMCTTFRWKRVEAACKPTMIPSVINTNSNKVKMVIKISFSYMLQRKPVADLGEGKWGRLPLLHDKNSAWAPPF